MIKRTSATNKHYLLHYTSVPLMRFNDTLSLESIYVVSAEMSVKQKRPKFIQIELINQSLSSKLGDGVSNETILKQYEKVARGNIDGWRRVNSYVGPNDSISFNEPTRVNLFLDLVDILIPTYCLQYLNTLLESKDLLT